jgi:hypothetical protein
VVAEVCRGRLPPTPAGTDLTTCIMCKHQLGFLYPDSGWPPTGRQWIDCPSSRQLVARARVAQDEDAYVHHLHFSQRKVFAPV